jgi:solute carrier family 10 (sodium/bile acid cotransporter), member 7
LRPKFGKLCELLVKNWFLLGLMAVLAIGILGHAPLQPLTSTNHLQTAIVFVVMLMMTAPIPMVLVRNCLMRPWPAILASLLNMGFLPLLAFALAPLLNVELAGGLIVVASIPSTQASAAVLTRRAGGDDSVAILGTLITNLSCAIVTPAWLIWLLGKSTQVDPLELARSLFLLVVVPIVIAQSLRLSNRFANAADRNKATLSSLCQVGILMMVLLGSIQMGSKIANSQGSGASMTDIAAVITLSTAAHLITLAVAWYLAAWTRIARPQQIAVAFSGSQKTLMIGLKLAIDCGVSILPMVIYHISQLVVDSVIAESWRKTTKGNSAMSSSNLTP